MTDSQYDPRTDMDQHKTPDMWAFIDGKQWVRPVLDEESGPVVPPGWQKDGRGFNQSMTYAEYTNRAAESPEMLVDIPAAELQVAAITSDNMKREIEDHLRKFHRVGYLESKTTKQQMIDKHDNLHGIVKGRYGNGPDTYDVNHMWEVRYREWQWTQGDNIHVRKTPHTHSPVPTINDIDTTIEGPTMPLDNDITDNDAAAKAIAKATEGGKPLNTTQRKALETLIDNDFRVLRGQMQTFANDVQAQRTADIQAEYAKKEAERAKVEEKGRELTNKHNTAMAELRTKHAQEISALQARHDSAKADFREDARTKGFDVDASSMMKVSVTGKDEAIKAVKDEVHSELNRALTAAERQRLAAQRTVLLASVTPQALDLLATIPDAKTMMLDAAKQQDSEAKAVEA